MPKVSILIPTYNSSHYLPQAIESALFQTFEDFEITVIDDGSKDNTKEIVRHYIDKYPGKITYTYQENRGLAEARNTGIIKSKGEYIALLDADDQWLSNRLEEGVKILEDDPSIGLVHGNINYMDLQGNVINTPKRKKAYLSGHIFNHIFLRKAEISCPTVLFRRSCCDKVGQFDANLTRLGCEDRDLWLRIAQEYKVAYIDKVLANYRHSPHGMSRDFGKMMKARVYVIDKYCPPGDKAKQRLRNKALSKIFRDIGDQHLFKKDFALARREYVKAIGHDPFSFWPWANSVKSVLKIKAKYS